MSQIIVSTKEIENKKNALMTLNSSLSAQISKLEALAKALSSMWEGTAKTSYLQALSVDIAKMKEFIKLVQSFISILQKIINIYEMMEKKSEAIANG